jgi:heavy metal efflux system protein
MFEDGTDIYLARQVVSERLQTAELPAGAPRPELGPVATGLGEVFHYLVTGDRHSLEELTTLHDWVIKPRLRSVPGVAEVNTWGGEVRQYQVVVDPNRLLKYDLTLDDVAEALRRNNLTVGGGLVTQAGESHLVHGLALTTTVEEIGGIVISARRRARAGARHVARCAMGHEIRRGAVTANGRARWCSGWDSC